MVIAISYDVIYGKFRYNYIIYRFRNFYIRKRNCEIMYFYIQLPLARYCSLFWGFLVKAIRLRWRFLIGNMQKWNFVYGLCDGNANAAQRESTGFTIRLFFFHRQFLYQLAPFFITSVFWYAVFSLHYIFLY